MSTSRAPVHHPSTAMWEHRHVSAVFDPAPDDRPFAVVDLGSNSGRMIVFRLRQGEHLDVIEDARAPLRLARALRDSDRLGPDAIERTLEALRDFVAVARGAGASQMIAVATSAVRDAADGHELIERAHRLGVPLQTIDGDHEAMLGFYGAVHDLPVDERVHVRRGRGQCGDLVVPRPTARPLVVDATRVAPRERCLPHVRSTRRSRDPGTAQVGEVVDSRGRDHGTRPEGSARRHRRYAAQPREGRPATHRLPASRSARVPARRSNVSRP